MILISLEWTVMGPSVCIRQLANTTAVQSAGMSATAQAKEKDGRRVPR